MIARILLIALILAGIALVLWFYAARWTPSRSDYPMQGISVNEQSGAINWQTLPSHNVDFAYILASSGNDHRDPAFARNLQGAKQAGLRYGAMHRFDLCRLATDQATLFVSTVPRDAAALPPAVLLDFTPDCPKHPGRDTVLSELNTFLNLIEAHSGKPALLRVSKAFDAEYDIGGGINRTLWLEGNFMPPDYASRAWVMWTASDLRRVDGVENPVEWDVVTP